MPPIVTSESSAARADGLERAAPGSAKDSKPRKSNTSKPQTLNHRDSATEVVRALRSGLPIPAATKARLPQEWLDASFIRHEDGLSNWLDASIKIRLRDQPEEVQAIEDALREALAEPPTLRIVEGEEGDLPKLRRLKVLGATELFHKDTRVEWLIKRLLITNQPALVAAPKKSLKTSFIVDFGVSLASGMQALDHHQFEIPTRRRVLIFSGEAAESELQGRLNRVCHSKGIALPDLEGYLFTCFQLPYLTSVEDLAELGEVIEETEAEVVIIDPAYLCLIGGGGPRIDEKSMFQVGPALAKVSEACLSRGATPIVVHHFRKGGSTEDKDGQTQQPELEDIAYAGFQEFARQWLLLKRREKYKPGTGHHAVWLTSGSSAFQGGTWSVDVEEGTMNDDFTGRIWEPKVLPEPEAIQNEQAQKFAAQREKKQATELGKVATQREHEGKILDTLQALGAPKTKSFLINNSRLNGKDGGAAIDRLAGEGRLIVTDNGRGKSIMIDFPMPKL